MMDNELQQELKMLLVTFSGLRDSNQALTGCDLLGEYFEGKVSAYGVAIDAVEAALKRTGCYDGQD